MLKSYWGKSLAQVAPQLKTREREQCGACEEVRGQRKAQGPWWRSEGEGEYHEILIVAYCCCHYFQFSNDAFSLVSGGMKLPPQKKGPKFPVGFRGFRFFHSCWNHFQGHILLLFSLNNFNSPELTHKWHGSVTSKVLGPPSQGPGFFSRRNVASAVFSIGHHFGRRIWDTN